MHVRCPNATMPLNYLMMRNSPTSNVGPAEAVLVSWKRLLLINRQKGSLFERVQLRRWHVVGVV